MRSPDKQEKVDARQDREPAHRAPKLPEWLFVVCRNRALDVRRKEKRMSLIEESRADVIEARSPDPADAVQRSEDASSVLSLLSTLPPNQQETIRLKFQGGLSYQEISRVTNLSVTNVGFLIHTGLKTIRTRLGVAATTARPA